MQNEKNSLISVTFSLNEISLMEWASHSTSENPLQAGYPTLHEYALKNDTNFNADKIKKYSSSSLNKKYQQ